MTQHRKKQSNGCNHRENPRETDADGKQFDRAHPHSTLSEVHRDEPNTQQENHKPPVVKPHRDPEHVRNRDLAFNNLEYVHQMGYQVSNAVASVSISGWASVRATRRSNSGSS